MKNIKSIVFASLLFICAPLALAATAFEPIAESTAYQNYMKRPKSDLSKLIYLLDRFKASDHLVLINGRQYPSEEASPAGKKYLFRNYKNKASARDWIKEHCYRTPGTGEVIHFQYEDGDLVSLRDVMLEQLEELEAFEAQAK